MWECTNMKSAWIAVPWAKKSSADARPGAGRRSVWPPACRPHPLLSPLMIAVLMILYGIFGIYQSAVQASIPLIVESLLRQSFTQACENSRFLTFHNVVPSTRRALHCSGAFLYPGRTIRLRCRSPSSHLKLQKIQMGGRVHGIQSWQRRTKMAALSKVKRKPRFTWRKICWTILKIRSYSRPCCQWSSSPFS